MQSGHLRLALLTGGAAVLLAAQAHAGGFAVREQSAYGMGSAYAGIAAGGALSAMFWNPATMTQMPGFSVEGDLAGIFPYAAQTPTAGSYFVLGGTGNTSESALVPSFYASYQLNPDVWIGMSFNAPYGLSVTFPGSWAGRNYSGNTSLRTYNATPSIAWRIDDWISVGFGIQVQYGQAGLTQGVTIPVPLTLLSTSIGGDGWGWGVTAGVTLTPAKGTTIGLGWRSQMDQKIDGTLTAAGIPGSTPGPVSTTLKLPDTVSLGVRQALSPQWTLLGTVEWTNWSRIGTSNIDGALVGGSPVAIHFEYRDGWLFSLGAEYQWTPTLAVRAGLGYEISPISDDVRIPLLPDNDRFWLSAGLTTAITDTLKLDIAYSHLFVRDTDISVTTGNPSYNPAALGTYFGTVDSHIDIVTVALRWSLWQPPKAAHAASSAR
jgi:long-chain fatty acid transport protein